jgi:UDP-N-acetylglucosamine 2-epimerase
MKLLDTGQHYDYSLAGIFLEELEIPTPDWSLGVGSASHAEQLARMLVPMEEIFRTERPACVVVYGDTNSTLGGALAAAKLGIPVAHVEAGLRSFDMTMPEEINRRLVDHISDLLLCPTGQAIDNLHAEGITDRVHMVGDVMADIALALAPAADRRWPELQPMLGIESDSPFAVATIHRASNTEPENLREIVSVLEAMPLDVVFPLHPRTAAALERTGLHVDLADLPNVKLMPPLGYLDLASAVRAATVVLTDSGGLQKEAYLHGTPCVTLRSNTEWTETVDTGMNVIVGRSLDAAVSAVQNALDGALDDVCERRPALYGDGDASGKILDALEAISVAGGLVQ